MSTLIDEIVESDESASEAVSEGVDEGAASEGEDDVADLEQADVSRLDRLRNLRFRAGWSRRWVLAGVVVAVIAAGWFGFDKYRNVSHELASLRQAEADRATASQLAKDYALKSLTYTFEDPDAFFHSVEDGVSQVLKDKYVNATELLKGIMMQAQVTSSGEVLATDAVAQPGQVYQVVVSAAQTTRNLQNPKARESLILLQVTVNKVGDKWQVSDIGPKTGSHAAAGPLGPLEPGPLPGR